MPLQHPEIWQVLPPTTSEKSGHRWLLIVPLQEMKIAQVERWLFHVKVKYIYFAEIPMTPQPGFVMLAESSTIGVLPGQADDGLGRANLDGIAYHFLVEEIRMGEVPALPVRVTGIPPLTSETQLRTWVNSVCTESIGQDPMPAEPAVNKCILSMKTLQCELSPVAKAPTLDWHGTAVMNWGNRMVQVIWMKRSAWVSLYPTKGVCLKVFITPTCDYCGRRFCNKKSPGACPIQTKVTTWNKKHNPVPRPTPAPTTTTKTVATRGSFLRLYICTISEGIPWKSEEQ